MGHNWIGILQPRDSTKPAQSGGCAQCHPGLGQKPKPAGAMTAADYEAIDCLICHAPDYKRTVVKEGEAFKLAPAAGVDLLKAARGVRRPAGDMCLRCHLATGGGPNHKHGVTPTAASDVHAAKGMDCIRCHVAQKHKIPGGSDLFAQELPEVKVGCDNCHKGMVHMGRAGAFLNKHVKRIACQTCHVPAIARDPAFPTIVASDWTKAVLSETTGLYEPTTTPAGNVKPVYRWWNRTMKVPREPVGEIGDKASKIFPWKQTDYTVIADAATGRPVFIKAGVYAVTGDPGAAAKKGAEDAKQDYSGSWKPVTESILWSVNHQVAPKAEALKCDACHAEKGVLDFRALGYNEARAGELAKPRQ